MVLLTCIKAAEKGDLLKMKALKNIVEILLQRFRNYL